MPKYAIPTLPYNISIPNSGTTQPVQAPPSRLPQHLRQAILDGRCRQQSVDTARHEPSIMYADIPWPNPSQDPPQPILLSYADPEPIEQLVAQIREMYPQLTAYQLKLQGLQTLVALLSPGGTTVEDFRAGIDRLITT